MSAFDDLYLEYKDGKHIPDKMYVWLKDFYNAGMERAAEIADEYHVGYVVVAIRKEIT